MLRRHLILTSLATCVQIVANARGAAAQSTFHGNNAHTGVFDSRGPAQLTAPKWVFKTEGPIIGSPVVANGVVFIGSTDGYLYAVDEDSGHQKWKFRTPTGRSIASSAAVAGGLVYIGGFDGALYAVAADSGTLEWTFLGEYERRFEGKRLHGYPPAAQTIPDSWDLYTSSPAVVDGRVYIGSGDGCVYAVDALTGVLQWKFATGDIVHASPAVVNGTVYIGSWDSNLYALDADTGREKWRFKAGEDPVIHNQQGFQSSPTVVEGVVYVGCRDGHLYAIDAGTGRKKWDYPTNKGWVNGTPAVRDGVVYVGTSDGYRFLGVDARTGRLRFSLDAKGPVFSSPALGGELAYVGVSNGTLLAIDAKSGTLQWRFQTDAAKLDQFKVLKPDGGLNDSAVYAPYFRDQQDMVVAFYRLFSLGAIWSSPMVDRGLLLFGSTDGNLYALQ